MTWVKLSDTFAEDPRLEEAGAEAFALHVAGLCYCARQLTDGHIAARAARRLWAMDDPDVTIAALVDAGLWVPSGDGFEVVDYLEDQLSAEEVRRQRQLKAERQRRWRDKKQGRGDASPDALRDGAPPRPAPPPKGGVGEGAPDGSADATPLKHPRGEQQPVDLASLNIIDETANSRPKPRQPERVVF